MDVRTIQSKVASVKSTQQITKAMGMVAASKMRKTQNAMRSSRPYAHMIRQVIEHLSQGNLEYKHPYLQARSIQRVGLIVVSTDRGLCGGLNVNVFKTALQMISDFSDRGIPSSLALIGQKAIAFFKSIGSTVLSQVSGMGDRPQLSDLIGLVNVMLEAYSTKAIDQLFLLYNQFTNVMAQTVISEPLLPIQGRLEEERGRGRKASWDYIYEPEPEVLLDGLLARFIESQVYQGVVENLACEQSARMLAMQGATENAVKLVQTLETTYNRMRQASITQELNEIVAGAAAV